MNHMTANQAAKLWNIPQRRVQLFCAENRISGVFKLGMHGQSLLVQKSPKT
jgi:hypothetical protein